DAIAGDSTSPTATIDAPVEGAVLTMPSDVVGTVTDATFLRYRLEISRADRDERVLLASGTAAVLNGRLGAIDPTRLENGLYRLVLTAEDVNGHTAVDERAVRVEGMAKVGNFRLSFTDLSIPLVGLPITITRTYDSRVKSKEDFGIGWTLDIARGFVQHNRTPGEAWQILPTPNFPCRSVTELAPHLTEIRLSDYETYTFALTISDPRALTGGCEATAGFRFVDGRRRGARLEILDGTDVVYLNGSSQIVYPDSFEILNPQKVRLITADGRSFVLERGSGVVSVEDLDGNSVTITKAGVIHSSGTSVAFARDDRDRITRITDPQGNTLHYSYDDDGNLASVVDRAGNRTTFSYDNRHNLLEILDPLGRRPVRAEYDVDGRVIAVTDANGNRRTVAHDLGAREELITDRNGQVIVVHYDARGNIVRRIDQLGQETTKTYDDRDNKVSETDPLGHTRAYTYDANDNRISETDPLGHTTTRTFNDFSEVLTETDSLGATFTNRYDTFGHWTSQTDRTGQTTRFKYDNRGRPISDTDPLGNTWHYAYGVGLTMASEITDPLGNVTTRSFSPNGLLLKETKSRLVEPTPQLVTRLYAYDALDRLVRD